MKTLLKCPIDYYTENLIFNADKSCWAAYELQGIDYDYLTSEKKIGVLYKLVRFLTGTMSELQILIIPEKQNFDENFENLKSTMNESDPVYKQALLLTNQTRSYLEDSSNNEFRTYIIAKLDKKTETDVITDVLFEGMGVLKKGWEYFIKNPVNAINVYMNLDTKDILSSEVERYKKLADKWFSEQSKRVSLIKLDVEKVQYLMRRVVFFGLNQDVGLFYKDSRKTKWEPSSDREQFENEEIIKPKEKEISKLFSGVIKQRGRTIMIDHDDKTAYQSYLCLTHIPDSLEFPGNEWIHILENYNLNHEMCIHIKTVEHRDALKKVTNKKREITSQEEHVAEANADIPEDLIEGKGYADILENELKTSRYPLLNTSVTIGLAADNEEQLEEGVTILKGIYEDMNFIIERPLTDQLNLFLSFIPSVSHQIKDFMMPLSPTMLAGGIFGITEHLGDKKGPYIGISGGKKVFLSLGEACLRNESAATTFYGNLGFGKSFNANLLVYLTVLYGGYGLIFDPKGERSHWEEDFSIFKGLINTVTLSSDQEDRGKLDPYNIYKDDIDLANELALNILTELFKISPTSDEYTALLEAAEKMKKETGLRSMNKLSEILDNFGKDDELYKTAKSIARRIRLQTQAGMARLLFGVGTEEAISIDNRLNILQIQNLKLPGPDVKKEDYTTEETISTVLMTVLSQFARQFALIKRDVFSVILFDESWLLGKTSEGIKLYDFLSRMGRSLYTGCIFNGHSVLDIPSEGIKNTIRYKFCFQTQNEKEVDRMLDYLDMEKTQENRELIRTLENGECLFQDMDRHVGKLKFDAVFDEIIKVFSTTPKIYKKEEAEERSEEVKEQGIEENIEEKEQEVKQEVEKRPESKKNRSEKIEIYEKEVTAENTEAINIYEKE